MKRNAIEIRARHKRIDRLIRKARMAAGFYDCRPEVRNLHDLLVSAVKRFARQIEREAGKVGR